MLANEQKNLRSPIVVVLGHVDHGKTSLLDYIRKTNVTAKEAGGITQATGAYEIEHKGKRITFIDTPGHEAFGKMRSRGAKVADLAILVVAADDSVKPQTKESIQILKQAQVPFVVAINKIDKNSADPERVKKDLAQNEVLLEGYGGDVSFELISAKTGEGIDKLLDFVLLAAEFVDLTYDPKAFAGGIIVEAKLDKFRGNEVTVVVKNGTLKKGDAIFTATAKGKIKALQNFLRENVNELIPSAPALILGFETLPAVGEEFLVGERPKVLDQQPKTQNKEQGKPDVQSLVIVLKADTGGSLEAASQILGALNVEGVGVRIFSEGVGNISDGDIKDADAAGATIIGFNVKADRAAETLAQNQNIKIITSNIVYELVQKLQDELKRIKTPPPIGIFEVVKIFNQKGSEQLIGGKVLEGEMRNKFHVDIVRAEVVLGGGRIKSLKMGKQDASRVEAGRECGVMLESGTVVEVGDRIVIPPPTK